VTDGRGAFTYAVGETVEFSVGGVSIGSAAAQPVVTPIDLVAAGSSTESEVQNISRFLMMLDMNSDPSDGITISAAVRDIAANWTPVDFAAGDFGNEVVTIVSDVASVDARVAQLPASAVAQDHLERTVHCEMSGYFVGRYAGGRTGAVVLVVDPADGMVTGWFKGTMIREESLAGVSVDSLRQFVVDARSGDGDGFAGSFDTFSEISGTWTFGDESGSFDASRVLADANAEFRFTGHFYRGGVDGFPNGPLVLNVDDQGDLVGESYDLASGNVFTATGTYIDQQFNYAWGDGIPQTGTADMNLNAQGTGMTSTGAPRPWFAHGCRLN